MAYRKRTVSGWLSTLVDSYIYICHIKWSFYLDSIQAVLCQTSILSQKYVQEAFKDHSCANIRWHPVRHSGAYIESGPSGTETLKALIVPLPSVDHSMAWFWEWAGVDTMYAPQMKIPQLPVPTISSQKQKSHLAKQNRTDFLNGLYNVGNSTNPDLGTLGTISLRKITPRTFGENRAAEKPPNDHPRYVGTNALRRDYTFTV